MFSRGGFVCFSGLQPFVIVSFGGSFISLLKCGGYWEMEVMNPVLENLTLIDIHTKHAKHRLRRYVVSFQ